MPSRRELANAVRALSMDAVQKAKSGHPGAPMGMADIAQVLWCDHLQHNPADPAWANRDRFVLSNGHGSMLLYSLLHLTGYELPIDELKQFRQLHSKTPGHPEYGYAPGVETTTGPLGQGITNAVGMALAEKVLAAQFNRDNFAVVDHYTYAFLGDGCLMEGISHEASSLAGTLGLNKLIAFWDDNGISIDGEVEGWFTDDTPKRFESYGWHVITDIDGHDPEAINSAIEAAKAETGKPTLICCKTVIGFGSPNKQGKEDCHGAPLGDDEITLTREALGWSHAPFEVPADIYAGWDGKSKGGEAQQAWNELFAKYAEAYPELAAELKRRLSGDVPADFVAKADDYIAKLQANPDTIASRKASQNALNAFGPLLPELLGGSADLAGSNLTIWNGCKGVEKDDASGNYVYYGVREFGMSAMMNGIALHGGFKAYGATFLMFMEYARNAVRMAALMKQPVIFVYTHDSIGLGEDGPTHQPVETLASLRAMPNFAVFRPCDPIETAECWELSLDRTDGPSGMVLTRQGVPLLRKEAAAENKSAKGAYVLAEAEGERKATLLATGSEVSIAMAAREALQAEGIGAAVVSVPCWELFDAQDASYREAVLGPGTVRVAVEAAIRMGWDRYIGPDGGFVGMDGFGASAPAGDLYKHFGITAEAVVAQVKQRI